MGSEYTFSMPGTQKCTLTPFFLTPFFDPIFP
jgi:hypothetical protein